MQWLADLADLGNLSRHNQQFRYILVVQDLFSRRLLGLVALKRKLSKVVAQALDEVIQKVGKAPKVFYTDSGLEFSGEMKRIYEKYNIKHATTNDFVQKAAPTERAILVVKQRLFKAMAANKTFRWTDKLDDVLKAYNETYNRSLQMTPNEAAKTENKHNVFFNTAVKPEIEKLQATLPQPFLYSIGQVVRVQMQQPFGKSYVGNYSQVLYTIYNRELKGGVPVYHLKELLTQESLRGSFYTQELQRVTLQPVPSENKIERIHSFRMVDNVEQVLVSYKDRKQKQWINYSDLLMSKPI